MFWVFATIIGFLSCFSKKSCRRNDPEVFLRRPGTPDPDFYLRSYRRASGDASKRRRRYRKRL